MSIHPASVAGYVYCETELRRHDRDRWLLSLFAPELRRPQLQAIACFNLELARTADQVSQPMLGEIRLQWWRESLEVVATGDVNPSPVLQALANIVETTSIAPEALLKLIDGRTMDLYAEPPSDLSALEVYAEGTAGLVNRLWLNILGISDMETVTAGSKIGAAYALLGHLRSLRYHLAAGRIFLPLDLLSQAGIEPDDLRHSDCETRLQPVVKRVAERADALLQLARDSGSKRAVEARPVLLMARLCDLYNDCLRRANYNPFATSIQVSGPRRQWALLTGALFRQW